MVRQRPRPTWLRSTGRASSFSSLPSSSLIGVQPTSRSALIASRRELRPPRGRRDGAEQHPEAMPTRRRKTVITRLCYSPSAMRTWPHLRAWLLTVLLVGVWPGAAAANAPPEQASVLILLPGQP